MPNIKIAIDGDTLAVLADEEAKGFRIKRTNVRQFAKKHYADAETVTMAALEKLERERSAMKYRRRK